MFDGPLVNLLKADTMSLKGNKFVTGVKIKAMCASKLDSPGFHQLAIQLYKKTIKFTEMVNKHSADNFIGHFQSN